MASFFFFQAEDGIRDLTVTGVQTCALPISNHRSHETPIPLPWFPQNQRTARVGRSEEHTSELQSQSNLVCRLLLEKKKSPARSRRDGSKSALTRASESRTRGRGLSRSPSGV